MWFYSPYLVVIVLVTIILYVAVCVAITPALRKRIEERFQRGAESQAFLVESITGVQTLKAAAVEPQMQSRWAKLLAASVGAGLKAARVNIIGTQPIQQIGSASCRAREGQYV